MTEGPPPAFSYEGGTYQAAMGGHGVTTWVDVAPREGGPYLVRLSLLCSVEVSAKRDETTDLASSSDGLGLGNRLVDIRRFERRSSAWERAWAELECASSYLIVRHRLHGQGALGRTVLLGGQASAPRTMGPMYSGTELPALFSPGPDNPRYTMLPSISTAVVGVSGDSLPGRGHWFFTPGPLCFALGNPEGPWTVIGLLGPVQDMSFPELLYQPADNGFRLELDYEGHTVAEGAFEPPAVVVIPAVSDPIRGIEQYREVLEQHGFASLARPAPGNLAPDDAAHGSLPRGGGRPVWWSEPIFCGWGAQCHLAKVRATQPRDQCTQENYDTFLRELADHDLHPGTVVIDDGWQEHYASATPASGRWPALRRWIDQRHRDDQKVLLWWKTWDPEGAPAAACVTNAAGEAVASGPFNEEATAWLQSLVDELLSADGLDADGLKVDFTAAGPRGAAVTGPPPGSWGISLLHRYLSVVYSAAKTAKPDALIVTQVANPAFTHLTDMVRLNDILRLDEQRPWAPVVEQMSYRAAVVGAACPGILVDTDDWCAPDLEQWRQYLAAKADIGVPALYYTTHLDHTGQALEERDYEQLRAVWAAVRARNEMTP